MSGEKDPSVRTVAIAKDTRDARKRLVISGVILTLFWGAILFEYWPVLISAALRLMNSARSVGAESMESPYFQVHNSSDASEAQVREVVKLLEKQYRTISEYTKTRPENKPQVLVVTGSGLAILDGTQLVISYNNGLMDTSLATLVLAALIQNVTIDPAGRLVPAGGQALQVVEATGLGDDLIRQPLNNWAVLIRQQNSYVPLSEAWEVTTPNSEDGYYLLLRAMLESGSFMNWFSEKYGLEAAQRVARGEAVETASGKTLVENEKEWLQWLDNQKIQPKSCEKVIPNENIFHFLCKKLEEIPKKPDSTQN